MSKKASFLNSFGQFFVAVLLILGIRWIIFEPYVIPSGSMIPSLLVNDHIVVSKFDYGIRVPFTEVWLTGVRLPSRGDIVVFKSPEKENFFMVKRVLGLPGETLTYLSDGQILVDGKPLDRRYIEEDEFNSDLFYQVSEEDIGESISRLDMILENSGDKYYRVLQKKNSYRWAEREFEVPEGQLFFVGDNRDNSRDSRTWGGVPVENLIGKARRVWLSCEKTLSQLTFVCDPRNIRWQRFLRPVE